MYVPGMNLKKSFSAHLLSSPPVAVRFSRSPLRGMQGGPPRALRRTFGIPPGSVAHALSDQRHASWFSESYFNLALISRVGGFKTTMYSDCVPPRRIEQGHCDPKFSVLFSLFCCMIFRKPRRYSSSSASRCCLSGSPEPCSCESFTRVPSLDLGSYQLTR